jgi:predicted MFS family arabinose efflux permease
VLPAAAAILATYATWRFGFGALVPVFLLLAVGMWIMIPSRTSAPINGGDSLSLATIRRILRATTGRGIPTVLSVHMLAAFVNQGFLALYPTYLVVIKGLSPSVAAAVYGFYFVVGVFVQPLSGVARDRFDDRVVLGTLLGVYFLSLLVLPVVEGLVAIGLVTVFLSSRNGASVITNTFISTSLPEEIKGSALGLLRTVWILVGSTSPFFIGFLADTGRFEQGFLVLAAVAGVAAVLTRLMPGR